MRLFWSAIEAERQFLSFEFFDGEIKGVIGRKESGHIGSPACIGINADGMPYLCAEVLKLNKEE